MTRKSSKARTEMSNRIAFRERLARIPQKNAERPSPRAWDERDNKAGGWIISSLLDILLNGWMYFLSGIAFTILSVLLFLDFLGLGVGFLIFLALAAFIYFVLKAEL